MDYTFRAIATIEVEMTFGQSEVVSAGGGEVEPSAASLEDLRRDLESHIGQLYVVRKVSLESDPGMLVGSN
ncbi:hypothetical protein J7U46_16780 [Pelomonas sp. V22]|uniref:hypothetical protein n=1 Tax=Pelomonas sp. V22 TaxID=2822139 RepID=UPI0024A8C745|nr:hypothetical protein [Pelomonas sp. V22]MDI4634718.1 hypothetical protein [Pelomonas sp. V22]